MLQSRSVRRLVLIVCLCTQIIHDYFKSYFQRYASILWIKTKTQKTFPREYKIFDRALSIKEKLIWQLERIFSVHECVCGEDFIRIFLVPVNIYPTIATMNFRKVNRWLNAFAIIQIWIESKNGENRLRQNRKKVWKIDFERGIQSENGKKKQRIKFTQIKNNRLEVAFIDHIHSKLVRYRCISSSD